MTIGIDVGATKVLAARVDQAEIVASFQEATDAPHLIDQIIHLVKKLGPYTHLGIGIPGQVKNGYVISAPNLYMRHTPLQKRLQSALDGHITLANDVQAGALGEYRYGAAQKGEKVLFVQLGTGIGGALMFHGQLIAGSTGEVGHMVIVENGLLCSCGRKGCWEAYASGWSLAQAKGYRSAKEVFQNALEPSSMQIVERSYRALVTGFTNLVNVLNPDLIIIGGGLCQGFLTVMPDFFLKLQTDIQKEALEAARDFTIRPSTQPNVIGCAALPQP